MLRLLAIGAAIPQALLLLHALMDILPFPKGEKGMWFEIRTGSVECLDEVSRRPLAEKNKLHDQSVDALTLHDELDIGGMEEDEPERESRTKASTF